MSMCELRTHSYFRLHAVLACVGEEGCAGVYVFWMCAVVRVSVPAGVRVCVCECVCVCVYMRLYVCLCVFASGYFVFM